MLYKYPEYFARFYDTIYHSIRDEVDNDYWLKQVLAAKGHVLEAGVGTGRLFMNSLERGADVFGLDISENMLNILYRKLPENQRFRISQQSIVDFIYDFDFSLVIAPFRVMMHLVEKDEQLAALNNICKHLEPGGKFIFDTFVPDLNQLLKGLDNLLQFEGEYEPGRKVRRYVSTKPDLINQLINIDFHLEWEENDGIHHEDWAVPMRFYFRYELEHLIERSDFSKYDIYGDFAGSELNKDSKEFVAVCRK
jgi:SAM-dependent methyltransferase